MKVYLDRDGRLTVEPENGTEQYALKHWGENYLTGDYSSVLSVVIMGEEVIDPVLSDKDDEGPPEEPVDEKIEEE